MRKAPFRLAVLGCLAASVPTAAAIQDVAPAECTAEERKPGTGVIEGRVIDGATAVPLQGVPVRLTWFASRGARRSERSVSTDRMGTFRFCDAPATLVVSVSAEGGSARSRAEGLILGDSERANVELKLAPTYARVRGRIIDHQTGRPVGSAAVGLGFDALRRLSADDGTFVLDSVPAGVYAIRVQHIAYAEVSDSLEVGFLARLELTIRLAPAAIPIDPIEVVVRSGVLELRGFYERQARGLGTFLTRQEIEAMHPLVGTDLLRRVAGIRLVPQRNWPGLVAIGRANCPFRFVIDGVRINQYYSMDEMPPNWIEGVEIYKGPSEVPIEYVGFSDDPNGNCGVIVVWTRNRA